MLAAFVIANVVFTLGAPVPAGAGAAYGFVDAVQRTVATAGHANIASLTLTLSLVCFGLLASLALLRARRRTASVSMLSRSEAMALHAEIDRLKALLLSEPQVLVEWPAGSDQPEIFGDSALFVPGDQAELVLAFGAWLEPPAAQRLEHAVETLRGEGRGFTMTLTGAAGRPFEAEGRAVAGRAVLRLRDIGGIEQELVDLNARHNRLAADLGTLTTLLDALPAPVWARDENGQLIFVNAAYARAVEAADSADAVARELELLDRPAREQVAEARAAGKPYAARLPAIVAGTRRIFDVVDVPSANGSAGMAIDRTEAETMRAELARMIEAHRRVLDQLATGVAIFNVDRKLTFYNTAFRSLFELDAGFLDQTPTDASVLDTLRTARKLPEERDFRQWKQQLYEAYTARSSRRSTCGICRTAARCAWSPRPTRKAASPISTTTSPSGSTCDRRYDALIRVQSETLDHLAEAVAVFGSDGRVRLHNPAFQRMWKLQADTLDQHPHIEAVTAWCQAAARRRHGVARLARRRHRHRRPRADRRRASSGATAW